MLQSKNVEGSYSHNQRKHTFLLEAKSQQNGVGWKCLNDHFRPRSFQLFLRPEGCRQGLSNFYSFTVAGGVSLCNIRRSLARKVAGNSFDGKFSGESSNQWQLIFSPIRCYVHDLSKTLLPSTAPIQQRSLLPATLTTMITPATSHPAWRTSHEYSSSLVGKIWSF